MAEYTAKEVEKDAEKENKRNEFFADSFKYDIK